jgi:hypothetical protein
MSDSENEENVTYRADDPDVDLDLDSVPLILHSSSDSFHSSCLVFAPLVMYHSCSLIRSFCYHMLSTSFTFLLFSIPRLFVYINLLYLSF